MSSVRVGRPTGRNLAGGLPQNPRARSVGRYDVRERETERYRERDRTRDSDYYSYRGTPSPAPTPAPVRAAQARSVRAHRSIASMSSFRGGPSSLSRTDVPEVPPLPLPRRSDESSKSSTTLGSYSSSSAFSSTFLDRMKGRGGGYGSGFGSGSSYTSFEEEREPINSKEVGSERSRWMRQRTAGMPEPEQGEIMDGDESLPGSQSGYGLSLWSRVATAASTLTISVSKAWAANIAAYSGERTPPGEESRLTRALKAYHIDKARDPTDLPEWLFEEHERRPIGRSGTGFRLREGLEHGEDEYRATAALTPPRAAGRGLRDVYDTAAAATAISSRQHEMREPSFRSRLPQDEAPPSKANDRLKALRDAKRQAAQRNVSVSSVQSSGPVRDEWPAREERGRSHGTNRGQGDGPHRRAPSLPASVRPSHGGGLPPRPGIRKI